MRVLVVQTAYLGDLILTTPLLRELHRARASTTVLTSPLGAEVFDASPFIERLIVHDKRTRSGRSTGLLARARQLRAGRFDAVIAAHRSHRSALLVRATGAPIRIGFAGAPGAWAYRQQVPWDPARHAVRRYLALAEPLVGTVRGADPRPAISVQAVSRAEVREMLGRLDVAADASWVCLAPGSVWPTKRWLPEGFAAVADALASRGLTPLLIGSPSEAELCRAVACACSVDVPVLAGETSIAQLAALLEGAEALVSNDSGPAHVASAVGTPVVSIFGPTVPAFGYTAFGVDQVVIERAELDCRPCDRHGPRRCPLGHFRCMREIDPHEVVRGLEALLARGGGRRAVAGGQSPAVRPG